MRTLCLIIEEMLDLARRTVICYDSEAFVIHIEDEILTLYACVGRDR